MSGISERRSRRPELWRSRAIVSLSTLTYDEVTARLDNVNFVPHEPHPYAAPAYTAAFQHFGAD